MHSQSGCDTLQQQLLSSEHHLGALTSCWGQERGHGLWKFPACESKSKPLMSQADVGLNPSALSDRTDPENEQGGSGAVC